MKIGFFTDRYFPQVDGVAVSVELFARELEKLGHEVIIFCPDSPSKGKDPKNVVRFRSFPSIWYEDHRDTIPFSKSVVNEVRDYKLDIIHIHTPAQIGIMAMRVAKLDSIPTVATHHTDIEQYIKVYKRVMLGILAGVIIAPAIMKSSDQYREILPSLKPQKSLKSWNRKVIRDAIALFYENCDAVVVPSEKIHKLLINYGLKKEINVIPTGVDNEQLNLTFDKTAKEIYKIDKNDKVLLFVGRLGQEKNIQLAIKSMPKILDKNPGTKLMIVGDGPYMDNLKILTNQLNLSDVVIFTGMLNRLETINCFRSCDIFCFPSKTDTQGLVINEAGLEGKPIVFTDDEISPVAVDGMSGIKADNTIKSFSSACVKLINDNEKRKAYGKKAKSLANKITINKQTEKLLKIYNNLV